ncbi:hypothetical protein BJX68DRAFT_51433 [Aspergillus pseudodeflectus]|uniref:Uncharacterized protein n=1 Tax=Aspergillus pseudodeflectus TaxID=176178 RepID=A0ABR4KLF3_9EURO
MHALSLHFFAFCRHSLTLVGHSPCTRLLAVRSSNVPRELQLVVQKWWVDLEEGDDSQPPGPVRPGLERDPLVYALFVLPYYHYLEVLKASGVLRCGIM